MAQSPEQFFTARSHHTAGSEIGAGASGIVETAADPTAAVVVVSDLHTNTARSREVEAPGRRTVVTGAGTAVKVVIDIVVAVTGSVVVGAVAGVGIAVGEVPEKRIAAVREEHKSVSSAFPLLQETRTVVHKDPREVKVTPKVARTGTVICTAAVVAGEAAAASYRTE